MEIPQGPVQCGGISESRISQDCVANEDALLSGFWHAYGNAGRVKLSHQSRNRGNWEYGINVLGLLVDPRKGLELDQYSWRCVQLGDGRPAWQHNKCLNSAASDGTGVCNKCWSRRFHLYGRFQSEVDIRANGAPPKMHNKLFAFCSPSVQQPVHKARRRKLI